MLMPTTRRGRYEFYRKRALRRQKLLRQRHPYQGDFTENRRCSRKPDNQFTPQQAPEKYLPPDRPPFPETYWLLPGHVKPDKGIWGVVQIENFLPPGTVLTHGLEKSITGYYFRRVKSCPRLHHWTYLPRVGPMPPDGSHAFYPFEFYPSGAYNPRWWFGRPDWPPVP